MQFYPLVVSQITDETSLAKSYTFRAEKKYQTELQYQAGQFLTLRLPWEDSFLDRCYSLSSSPDESEWTITVKRVEDGRISNYINDTLQVGDIVDIAPPSGRFIATQEEHAMCLFAAGSGITPIISIIKHTLHNSQRHIALFYANRNEKQTIFLQQLKELAHAHPDRFQCHFHYSADQGRVNENTINHFVHENIHQDFFICGPAPFMDLTENALLKLGVADKAIFVERFVSDTETKNDNVHAASDITSFKATLDGQVHTVPYLADKTLLESMLADGLKPAYFCQKAKCGMCMVKKTTGEVVMRNSDILSDNDIAHGRILLCQSLPLDDNIHVDCDND